MMLLLLVISLLWHWTVPPQLMLAFSANITTVPHAKGHVPCWQLSDAALLQVSGLRVEGSGFTDAALLQVSGV